MTAPGYLDLGGIIAALEAQDPKRVLPFGFHEPHSYRGYYNNVAFEPAENITIGDMLAAARSALGATYQGWKGGDFTMTADTDCWLANRGDSSNDQIGPVLLSLMLGQPDGEPQPEPPALPDEPPAGTMLLVGADVWVRLSDGEQLDGWYCTGMQQHHDWADIAPDLYGPLAPSWRTPVALVPAPLLAALVEALRTAALFRHDDLHIGDLATCAEQDCADDRALLAKVTGQVTA